MTKIPFLLNLGVVDFFVFLGVNGNVTFKTESVDCGESLPFLGQHPDRQRTVIPLAVLNPLAVLLAVLNPLAVLN